MAIAGFSETELFIQLEDNQLVICSNQDDGDESHDFLHRGIAAPQFRRNFYSRRRHRNSQSPSQWRSAAHKS
ncbi:MAG: Hsp20 family protein [Candidatus Latescibacterota bacterium]